MADAGVQAKLQRVSELTAELEKIEAELEELTGDLRDGLVGRSVSPRLTRTAQAALAASEQRFRAIFDASLDGMLITDVDGQIVDANMAAAKILGVEHTHLVGSAREFFRYDLDVAAQMERELAQAGYSQVEFPVWHGNGTQILLEISVIGNVIPDRVLAVFRDITARREAETRLQQMLAANKHFATGLTRLIQIANQLSQTPSVDEFCRQAVIAGRVQLGFSRLSIWLVDRESQLLRGTFGTDELGDVRDERAEYHDWTDVGSIVRVMSVRQGPVLNKTYRLTNHRGEMVGDGEHVTTALWGNDEVVGVLAVDNYFTREAFTDEQIQLIDLFAAAIGHLLTLKRAEAARMANEDLLDRILDVLPVEVYLLDKHRNVLRYNRAAANFHDRSGNLQEVWIRQRARWLHDGRPVERDEWASVLALTSGEAVLGQEMVIETPEGGSRAILNSAVPIVDDTGTLTGAVVVNQDITEQVRREQHLSALVRLGQAMRPLLARHDIVVTTVHSVNRLLQTAGVALVSCRPGGIPQVEAATGMLTPLEGLRVRGSDVGQGDGARLVRQTIVYSPGLPNAAAVLTPVEWGHVANPPVFVVETPLVVQGQELGVLAIGYARIPDSRDLELLESLADSAAAALQRAQYHEEILTQAQRLDRVMETVNLGLLMLDHEGHVVLANRRAQKKLAKLAGIQVGERLTSLADTPIAEILAAYDSLELNTVELRAGESIYEVTASPLSSPEGDAGWLLALYDVTQARMIRESVQQHERLASVGQLAAGIAHDFNNVIAVILLYVQMLQRNSQLDEGDQNRLKVIREQAQHASKLIRQILDFSRQTMAEREAVELAKLLAQTITLWKRTLPESIHYQLDVQVPGPAVVMADPTMLQQALTNLALNARDAMPRGGELLVTLRARLVEAGGDPQVPGLAAGSWYQVSVTDTGSGIAPEVLPRIFDPFFTTKGVGKGTGLGMAQVYGIVRQNDGLVTAESEVGVGTTISIFLPVTTREAADAPTLDLSDMQAGSSETILLAEDNESARDATAAVLEMAGHQVLTAADGEQALALFMQHADSIQLVITDMVMPHMSGEELYYRVHAAKPEVPMLVITGYPLDETGRQLLQDHRIAYLQKPFLIKELLETVTRMIDEGRRNRRRGITPLRRA